MTMLFEKIMNVIFLIMAMAIIVFLGWKTANSQQTYAYYECENLNNSFVKFEAPDTNEKRKYILDTYNCNALPQIVFDLPEGANVLSQNFINTKKDIIIKMYQSVKSFDKKRLK